MAFLLSPKTGGATQAYLFFSNDIPVSINGGGAKTYGKIDPGNISTGDVLTWATGDTATITYENDEDSIVVKTAQANSPYTVEAAPGADVVKLTVKMS